MTPSAASALAITLAVEIPIVALLYPGERTRMAAICALATAVTNLVMNAWLLSPSGSYQARLVGGELGATALEAVAYALASRERSAGRALVASGLANAASFAAGLLSY